ncbi:hypothetical protein KIL84_013803 [Mauremys mutica]|uniref:Uncharacterized protein n=1 Tax=Mauremys mutica TaxID=74926 RepID=A0A9D4ASG3_9SAUR|nr:hypothetical protein KIL84_013803 [Mauremys mutica]
MVQNRYYIHVSTAPGNSPTQNKILRSWIRNSWQPKPLMKNGVVTLKQPSIRYHKNLEYLHKAKVLNQRQVRWAVFFSLFDYIITYRLEARNEKVDSLSRKVEYYLSQEMSSRELSYILKPCNFLNNAIL